MLEVLPIAHHKVELGVSLWIIVHAHTRGHSIHKSNWRQCMGCVELGARCFLMQFKFVKKTCTYSSLKHCSINWSMQSISKTSYSCVEIVSTLLCNVDMDLWIAHDECIMLWVRLIRVFASWCTFHYTYEYMWVQKGVYICTFPCYVYICYANYNS